MIRITDNHAQRLARLNPARILPAMGEVIAESAKAIEDTARTNLNDGAISGAGHVPGPPGGYSSSDTHELEQSFHVGEVIESAGGIQTAVIADAPHAIYQELGTSRVAARPNMQLATEEIRPTVLPALGNRFIGEVNG